MMMGRQTRGQEQFFYEFSLDEVVPADHLVRRIDAVLDTSWVHRVFPCKSTAATVLRWNTR